MPNLKSAISIIPLFFVFISCQDNNSFVGIPGDKSDTETGIPGDKSDTETGISGDESDTETGIPGDESDTETGIKSDCDEMKLFFEECAAPGFPAPTYLQMQDFCAGATMTDHFLKMHECWSILDSDCMCSGTTIPFSCGTDECEQYKNCIENC